MSSRLRGAVGRWGAVWRRGAGFPRPARRMAPRATDGAPIRGSRGLDSHRGAGRAGALLLPRYRGARSGGVGRAFRAPRDGSRPKRRIAPRSEAARPRPRRFGDVSGVGRAPPFLREHESTTGTRGAHDARGDRRTDARTRRRHGTHADTAGGATAPQSATARIPNDLPARRSADGSSHHRVTSTLTAARHAPAVAPGSGVA
jgi:hypothetical protein